MSGEQTHTRPEHVPEKYFNATTGEIDTKGMMTELSYYQKQAAPPADPVNPTAPPAPQGVTLEQAQEAASAELQRDGKLSERSYQDLAALGYDRSTVDTQIAGMNALQQQNVAKLHGYAGDEATFNKTTEWMNQGGATADEVAEFNRVINDPNASDFVKQATVQAMTSRAAQVTSNPPALRLTGDPAPPAPKGFGSDAEIVAAMSDPRYASDAAYRAQVEQTMAATTA